MVLSDFRRPISSWRFLWFARRPKLAWVKPSFAIFKCLRRGTTVQALYIRSAVGQAMSRVLLKWGTPLRHGGGTGTNPPTALYLVSQVQRLRIGISKQSCYYISQSHYQRSIHNCSWNSFELSKQTHGKQYLLPFVQITAASWRPVCNDVTLSSSCGKMRYGLRSQAFAFFLFIWHYGKSSSAFKEKRLWKQTSNKDTPTWKLLVYYMKSNLKYLLPIDFHNDKWQNI